MDEQGKEETWNYLHRIYVVCRTACWKAEGIVGGEKFKMWQTLMVKTCPKHNDADVIWKVVFSGRVEKISMAANQTV